MPYIRTVSEEQAEGALRDLYAKRVASQGYVPNHTRALSLRPDSISAWQALIRGIHSHMSVRRYELVTIAAASALRSTYCMLAHGSVLRSEVFTDQELEAIARDFRSAGLPPAEVAMMAYAQKIALHAYRVVPEDVDLLRTHGFTDEEILDIALAAAARCFFSKLLDAIGAEPDEAYAEFPPELREALTVGRPFRPLSD